MRLRVLLGSLVVVITAGVGPAPLPAPLKYPTIEGVTLGENAAAVLKQRGEPIGVYIDGDTATYEYLSPAGNAVDTVHFLKWNAVGVGIEPTDWPVARSQASPTPSLMGITFTDSLHKIEAIPQKQLLRTHVLSNGNVMHEYRSNDGLEYIFIDAAGKIVRVSAYVPAELQNALPPSSEPKLHDGSSMNDAIVLAAPNDELGLHSEYMYVRNKPCANDGSGDWRPTSQSITKNRNHFYDRLDLVCTTDNSAHVFFFDITSFAGKF